MTELQTFDFPVARFSEAGKALLTLAIQHPTWFAVYSMMISTGIILIVIPRAIGFCTTGSTKGEFTGSNNVQIVQLTDDP